MAAKKAPKRPKFTPRPYKPRKPKPKPRRTDDEILSDARKDMKKITEGPKFSHRPYKPKRRKTKVPSGDGPVALNQSGVYAEARARPGSKQDTQKRSGNDSNGTPLKQHQPHGRVTRMKVISTNDPSFPVGYSSRSRGTAENGLVLSSETFVFVFEQRPLNIYQFDALLQRRGIVEAPREVLYALSIYYRKSQSPWDSDMPVLVFSLDVAISSQSFLKNQSPLCKAWGDPMLPGTLKVFRYAARSSPFVLFLPEKFDVDQSYNLLLSLGLRELRMSEHEVSFVGKLQDVKASNPSIS